MNNTNIINYYLYIRDFLKLIWYKILWLEKNNIRYDNYIILFFINLIPHIILFNFLHLLNFNFLFKKDDILYHYPSCRKKLTISKPVMNIGLSNDNNIDDVTELFSKFDNTTPIYIILQYNKIKSNKKSIIINYFDNGIKQIEHKIKDVNTANLNLLLQ